MEASAGYSVLGTTMGLSEAAAGAADAMAGARRRSAASLLMNCIAVAEDRGIRVFKIATLSELQFEKKSEKRVTGVNGTNDAGVVQMEKDPFLSLYFEVEA
ncbi:hypothetical protein BS50DRAFT_60700 [Corynespora cassiicola Philippines]|uniref:Uncharacterized protein n=1 Tax=Corynespora cassiicola Philippines TaxID=1448308 RepID=A0A2T2NJA2_CORCC|nr:hypothetical protein BS50DRAFT_60700 [Corynespora cassiicola Philippines]